MDKLKAFLSKKKVSGEVRSVTKLECANSMGCKIIIIKENVFRLIATSNIRDRARN